MNLGQGHWAAPWFLPIAACAVKGQERNSTFLLPDTLRGSDCHPHLFQKGNAGSATGQKSSQHPLALAGGWESVSDGALLRVLSLLVDRTLI